MGHPLWKLANFKYVWFTDDPEYYVVPHDDIGISDPEMQVLGNENTAYGNRVMTNHIYMDGETPNDVMWID